MRDLETNVYCMRCDWTVEALAAQKRLNVEIAGNLEREGLRRPLMQIREARGVSG